MIYLLHAVAFLAGLLAAALLVACAARHRRRWLRWTWPILFGWLPAGYVGLVMSQHGAVNGIQGVYVREPTVVVHLTALALGYATILPLSFWGLACRRRTGDPRAHSWRVGRLALALMAMPLVWAAAFLLVDWRVRGQLQAAELEGERRIAELARAHEPDANDAIHAYSRVFELLVFDDSPLWEADVYEPAFEIREPEVASLLYRHRRSLESIVEASRIDDCRFTIDEWGPDELEQEGMFRVRHLTVLAAWHALATADFPRGVELLDALRRMSHQYETNPLLYWQMQAYGLQVDRLMVVERAFPAAERPLSGIELPIRHDGDPHRRGIQDAIESFAAWELRDTGRAARGLSPPGEEAPPPETDTPRWAFAAAMATLRVFRAEHFIREFPRLVERARSAADRLPGGAEQDYNPRVHASHLLPEGKLCTMASAQADLLLEVRLHSAEIERSLDVALAAEAYRAAHGRYPEDAVQLVPEFLEVCPTDPGSGAPVNVLVLDGGAIVYAAASFRKRASRYTFGGPENDQYHLNGAVCLGGLHNDLREEYRGRSRVVIDEASAGFALLRARHPTPP